MLGNFGAKRNLYFIFSFPSLLFKKRPRAIVTKSKLLWKANIFFQKILYSEAKRFTHSDHKITKID